jgi:hypothetical protein
MKKSKYEDYFLPFVNLLNEKMKKGFQEYGDKSFDKDLVELINEIEEELLDICGWGMILYTRLEDMKKKAEELKTLK